MAVEIVDHHLLFSFCAVFRYQDMSLRFRLSECSMKPLICHSPLHLIELPKIFGHSFQQPVSRWVLKDTSFPLKSYRGWKQEICSKALVTPQMSANRKFHTKPRRLGAYGSRQCKLMGIIGALPLWMCAKDGFGAA